MTETQLLAEVKAIIAQGPDPDTMSRRIMVLMLRELGHERGAAMDHMHGSGGGVVE